MKHIVAKNGSLVYVESCITRKCDKCEFTFSINVPAIEFEVITPDGKSAGSAIVCRECIDAAFESVWENEDGDHD
jgi:hypothetical protein